MPTLSAKLSFFIFFSWDFNFGIIELMRIKNKAAFPWQCALRVPRYLLVSSAENLCKQFGPRSGPTKRRS